MTTLPPMSRRGFLGAGAAMIALASSPPGAAGHERGRAVAFARTREAAAAAARGMIDAEGVPSISWALMARDGIVWADASGAINRRGTPPDKTTLYGIGSCSKVIAAAAVMKLIERGAVDLDAPLMDYIPAFRMESDAYRRITVRMLMNHSSGLPGTDYRGAFTTGIHEGYAAQVMATLAHARLKHAPGEMSVYCNDGFTLLEPLISGVSGKPFTRFVRDELFSPLGMRRSRYGDLTVPDGQFAPAFSHGQRLPREVVNASASGGLYTTPTELGRFLSLFLNEGRFGGKQVLSPASVRLMAENQAFREEFRPLAMADGYGLGWDAVGPKAFAALGVEVWRKNGGTATYGADMIVAPGAGLAVAVMGASPGFPAATLSERIMLEALVEQGTLAAMPPPVEEVAKPAVSRARLEAAWFDGVFANATGLYRLEPNAAGGARLLKAEEAGWTPHVENLQPRSDGSLASEVSREASYRLLDYRGFTYLVLNATRRCKLEVRSSLFAQKLPGRGELSARWKARVGGTWLQVNEPGDSFFARRARPILRLVQYPGLPGHVVVRTEFGGEAVNQVVDPSQNEYRALMCLQIPSDEGRDLNDLEVAARADGEWLRFGSAVYRPLPTAPNFGVGKHRVKIGPEGNAEWRVLDESGRIDIRGCSGWQLFDREFTPIAEGKDGASGLQAAAAAFLMLRGDPGADIAVACSPA